MKFVSKKIQEKSTHFLKDNNFSFNKKFNSHIFFGPEVLKNKKRIVFSRNLFIGLIIFLIIFFYTFFGFKNLFSAPEIVIDFPQDNYVTHEKTVEIKGRIKGEGIVAINNQIITLNQNSFEETLTLFPGVNLIKISARKKFSPEKVIFRRIIVE